MCIYFEIPSPSRFCRYVTIIVVPFSRNGCKNTSQNGAMRLHLLYLMPFSIYASAGNNTVIQLCGSVLFVRTKFNQALYSGTELQFRLDRTGYDQRKKIAEVGNHDTIKYAYLDIFNWWLPNIKHIFSDKFHIISIYKKCIGIVTLPSMVWFYLNVTLKWASKYYDEQLLISIK